MKENEAAALNENGRQDRNKAPRVKWNKLTLEMNGKRGEGAFNDKNATLQINV